MGRRRKRGWWWPKMAMWHQVDLTIVHVRGLRKRGWGCEGGREEGGVKEEKRNLPEIFFANKVNKEEEILC
jgi:hypothetical protein